VCAHAHAHAHATSTQSYFLGDKHSSLIKISVFTMLLGAVIAAADDLAFVSGTCGMAHASPRHTTRVHPCVVVLHLIACNLVFTTLSAGSSRLHIRIAHFTTSVHSALSTHRASKAFSACHHLSCTAPLHPHPPTHPPTTQDFNGYVWVFASDVFTAANGVYIRQKLDAKDLGRSGLMFYNCLFSLPIALAFVYAEGSYVTPRLFLLIVVTVLLLW
jgi:hypothetical protein